MHIAPLRSQLHPRSVAHASGGGAPCLTAGDARAVARVNPWGCVQRGLRRQRRRTESVERITTVDAVRHLWCRKVVDITIPRVLPSGIICGYAWCVPSGDSGCGSHHKKSGISDKKRPKMGLFCSYMTKVCIVSVANLSQLCTLPLYDLSCILAA